MTTNRPLRVFLCHSSNDKPAVRELYQKLRAEGWIEPWLDEEKLHPGDTWEIEIEKAVESSDVVIVCLSNGSITKRGFVQKELRFALDVALEMPEETIFIIPLRLEECTPPRSLRDWHYADYFEGQRDRAFKRLLVSLKRRADTLSSSSPNDENTEMVSVLKGLISGIESRVSERTKELETAASLLENKITLSNGMEFMRVPAGKFIMGSAKSSSAVDSEHPPQYFIDIPYDYFISRFTVTNELYASEAKILGLAQPESGWERKKNHPAVHISWDDAVAYCQWMNIQHARKIPSGLVLRLPTEAEWEKAARGKDGREFPWGNEFDASKCNSKEGKKKNTTPVGSYSPKGDSPFGCADMAGNVWEWTHSLNKIYPYDPNDGRENEDERNYYGNRVSRGGGFDSGERRVRCAVRYWLDPVESDLGTGFRLVLAPRLS